VEFTAGPPLRPIVQLESLRISEIMYHPLDGSDFEFIELVNTGASRLDLSNVSITDGIEFSFAGSQVTELLPGAAVVVVKNLRVFQTRYGEDVPVAGEYRGKLDNDGERLTLTFGKNLTILDFAYLDTWYPLTDGAGHSLEIVDLLGPPSGWGEAESWRRSESLHGSPGIPPGGEIGGLQRVGDANQDGEVDISDVMGLVGLLYFSAPGPLPCQGDSVIQGGNLSVLDVSADGSVDLSDAVYLLYYLFKGGPAPVRGAGCIRISGCDDACQ